jgi:PEP-CTERM motif
VRLSRLLVLLALVGMTASAAMADPVDPKILVGGGGSCAAETLTDLTQSFTGVQTGCPVDFLNNILGSDDQELNLNHIVVNIVSNFSGPLSCDFDTTEGVLPSPFTNTPVLSSPTSCTFSAPITKLLTGVPFGNMFSLNFDTNFGSTVDIIIAPDVIPTPEPGTMLLLTAGLAGICALRKRRRAQQFSSSY